MSDLKRQLSEDRAMRNTARSIIFGQFLRVREAVSGKRIGTELADKVVDDALDLADRAGSAARANRGLITAIAGVVGTGVALWLARKPIAALVGGATEGDNGGPQTTESFDEADASVQEANPKAEDYHDQ